MKLKTLMKNYDGSLIIFQGDYEKDNHHELIARIGCVESDTTYFLEDEFENIDERIATANKVLDCVNLNINKMYVNINGKLVAFVK